MQVLHWGLEKAEGIDKLMGDLKSVMGQMKRKKILRNARIMIKTGEEWMEIMEWKRI